MPLSSKSSHASMHAVVEVGLSHVAAARFSSTAGGTEMTAFAFRELSVVDDASEVTANSDRAAALREVATILNRRESATLVIPGHLALAKTIKLPVVASAQREKLITFEAKQSIPFPLDEVFWDYQTGAESEGELEVLVVAAKSDGVREIVEQAQAAGIVVDRVVPAGIAMDGLSSGASDGELRVGIGARSTHLLFCTQQTRQLRTLSLAGQTVTRGIADKLDQTLIEAERLKLGVFSGTVELPADTPAGETVKEAADSFAARLQLEINRSLVTQVRQAGVAAPGTLALTGGGANMPGLGEHLAAKWSGAVVELDPLAGIEFAAGVESEVMQAGSGRLADLVGAARGGDKRGINLAPPELGAARDAKRRRPRWLIAAGFLIGALLLPGVHFKRLADARQTATIELGRRIAPVQALQEQNQRNEAELVRLQAEIAKLDDLVKSRDAWTALLADLQTSIVTVGDVWLEGLQVVPSPNQPAAPSEPTYDAEGRPVKPVLPPLRLRLSGRFLDRDNPLSRVSQSSYERVTALLAQFVESPRVLEVEGERFDASESGILRFDFTLVINPTTHL
ncbi:pilus assembly protein PilM [Opitutaceae bacterium]|nr:pilus assembly protein PilM [Opitutaceae bacterium]